MQIDLKNKNALVCGSTQGIGKASALALAQCGANVTLVARDEQRLIQAKDELPNIDGQAHQFLIADFRNPEALAQAVQKQIDDSTAFHILVNNTGGPPGGDVFEASLVEFENAFTQPSSRSSGGARDESCRFWTNHQRNLNVGKTTARWTGGLQYDSRSSGQLGQNTRQRTWALRHYGQQHSPRSNGH